jgi:signal transduction histidine kinase
VLEGLGLADSLRALADRTDGEGPAHVGASVQDIPGLSQGKTTALYRIAREAVINAKRHARPGHIWLSLRQDEGHGGPLARLLVEDDGDGFDVASRRVDDHYGIAMMEEQAAVVGGSLRIVSEPGRGTLVEGSIPVGNE